LRQVRTTLIGYSCGFIVTLLLCWKFGAPDEAGRFHIAETSLGNPNDLALNLLYGIAFLSILLVRSGNIRKLFFLVCFLASMYFILKTGSRANFITFGVLLLVAWKIASGRARMMMVVAGVTGGLLLAAVIPKQMIMRLTTFGSASAQEIAEYKDLRGAVGSTEARKRLQIRAIKLTLLHPVFGVGPYMFVYAVSDFMVSYEGLAKGSWQRAHNTYLDLAAETGFIGIGLYVTCIAWCLRTNYRSVRAVQRRPDLQHALGQSCCLLFAAVVFSFGTLFCSLPYIGHMPFLLGLTAANWLALRDAGAFITRGTALSRPAVRAPKRVAAQPELA
jgi:O-antigen ligase